MEDKFDTEFDNLRQKSKKLYKTNKISQYEEHKNKNRYVDILSYKLTMATTDGKGYNGSNYFNGNYIVGQDGGVDYVACQGPLKNTFDDFWNVVLVNNIHTIVGKLYFS